MYVHIHIGYVNCIHPSTIEFPHLKGPRSSNVGPPASFHNGWATLKCHVGGNASKNCA